jgi:hypothetical protein
MHKRAGSSPDRWSEAEAEAESRTASSSGRREAASSSYGSRPAELPEAIPWNRRQRRALKDGEIGGAARRNGEVEVGGLPGATRKWEDRLGTVKRQLRGQVCGHASSALCFSTRRVRPACLPLRVIYQLTSSSPI